MPASKQPTTDSRYGSPWTRPQSERRSPVSELHSDVIVVGGGMVGVSAAYMLAREGVGVTLLEAREIGGGVTGNSSAKLSGLHGAAYSEIGRKSGVDAAHRYAELNAAGIRFVEETTERHRISCGLRHLPAVSFAETPEGLESLVAEESAVLEAGLAGELSDRSDLPFPVSAALTLDNQAHFDPVAWTRGMARAVEEAGGRVFERSLVTDVEGIARRRVRLADGNHLTADRVILATHIPFLDRAAYFARLSPMASFAISGRASGDPPSGLYLSVDGPTRSIAPVVTSDGSGTQTMLVGGEGHRPGTESALNSVGRLREYARERFGLDQVEYCWGAHDQMSFDRLPLVGKMLPLESRILVATGFSKWGLAAGAGSARILADHVLGDDTEDMAVFNPNRVRLRSTKALIEHNLDSGRRLVGDRLLRGTSERPLGPGEGEIVGNGLRKTAVCRDLDGRLHRVSARCTHLGCLVAWNAAGQTWDCPCHGSRFAPDGEVVEGPATAPLGSANGDEHPVDEASSG